MINICILCLILLVCFLYLLSDVFKIDLIKNIKEIFYNHKFLVCAIILLPLFSFLTVIAKSDDNKMSTDINMPLLSVNDFSAKLNDISLNKVVIVGDSRMEFIYNKKDKLDIPTNFIFDAKSGATIDWLIDTGEPKLREILDNRDTNYKYHVVFNLGVNDLNDDVVSKTIANDYLNIYKNIINDYPDINFYFLSVNPIDEDIIYDYFPGKRTDEKIEMFNAYFGIYVQNVNDKRIKYCDSYNRLDFNLPDGLHYDDETDQQIIDYISRDCINYER